MKIARLGTGSRKKKEQGLDNPESSWTYYTQRHASHRFKSAAGSKTEPALTSTSGYYVGCTQSAGGGATFISFDLVATSEKESWAGHN